MTYTDAIAELESLLEQLQEVPTNIDQLESRVARAQVLVEVCRARLRDVEVSLDALDKTTDSAS